MLFRSNLVRKEVRGRDFSLILENPNLVNDKNNPLRAIMDSDVIIDENALLSFYRTLEEKSSHNAQF